MASSSSTSSASAPASAVAAASSSVNAIEQLNGVTIYLPTGYRFGPSDKTIVIHYLKNKIRNQPLPVDIIPRTEVYSFGAPEKIPLSTSKYGLENQWYFFTTRPKENPIITSDGCWKEIRDEEILDGDEVVGFMRTLRYHYEEPLNVETNTNWYIDEYSVNPDIFESDELDDDAKEKVSNFVVCKVRFSENMSDKACHTDSDEEGNAILDDEEEERPTRSNIEDKEVENGESMVQARKNK
ncbi:NAC domain-containing protein 41-like [Actinidia eriantha]|uniref:NAC domain-containing protein 41-like n=1 Tax=Actinidia eriantha TaxID=165200 RepID=UPI00258858FA|nr:NAC domain-containing protein 41-like [Actinidia eriantha]